MTPRALSCTAGAAAILPTALTGLRPDTPLAGRIVRVEPIAEHHREGLREAAEREPQIHRYTGMYSLGFDRWFDEALDSEKEVPFVVHVDGRPVGSTRYMNIEPFHRRTEIGWTWLERPQWGTGANIETKYLLLRNAFDDWGAMRVEFKTDARNLRVRGALLGIGATFEGIFRKHMLLPDSIRRLGVVRNRRRRLAGCEVSTGEEDRQARGLTERLRGAKLAPHGDDGRPRRPRSRDAADDEGAVR